MGHAHSQLVVYLEFHWMSCIFHLLNLATQPTAPSLAVSDSRTTQAWVPSPALSLTSCVTRNIHVTSLSVHSLILERKLIGHSHEGDHGAGAGGSERGSGSVGPSHFFRL